MKQKVYRTPLAIYGKSERFTRPWPERNNSEQPAPSTKDVVKKPAEPTKVDDVEYFGGAVAGDGTEQGAAAVVRHVHHRTEVGPKVLHKLDPRLLLPPELDMTIGTGCHYKVRPVVTRGQMEVTTIRTWPYFKWTLNIIGPQASRTTLKPQKWKTGSKTL